VKVGSVTARYAEALFELAREKGELDRIERDVDFLAGELSVESVSGFLLDARIPIEEKRERLEFLQPHVHELTYNFVRLLLDKRRVEVLVDLGAAFRQRSLDARGAAEGWVECARPLADADLQQLAAHLGAELGKVVQLETRIVPDLIGGARVFVSNRMIDLSVQGRLEGLRTHLRDARLSTG